MSQDNKKVSPVIVDIESLALSPSRPVGAPIAAPSRVELRLARKSLEALDAITVRPNSGGTSPYEILVGVRTWQLVQELQLDKVVARIVHLSDCVAHDLVARDFGVTLDSIAEAELVNRIVDEGYSVTVAGALLGLSRYEASHRRRLLRLHPVVQDMVRDEELPLAHARSLVTEPVERQLSLAQQVAREHLSSNELRRRIRLARGAESVTVGDSAVGLCGDTALAVEQKVSEAIGVPVTIVTEGTGGELRIAFADRQVLSRILECIGVVDTNE